ncbi:barstar family protein [Streptomyces virginiae]|uniref:barstar family protein n=1 Tax=Streptomyces virginiae TaxID=1961 RepID=UPI00368E4FFF
MARLDGREMPDTDAVFRRFYDGLELPDQFGWNWNALYDCLRDLRRLTADHHVLIVEAAAGRQALVVHAEARQPRTRPARGRPVLRHRIRPGPPGTAAVLRGGRGHGRPVDARACG